MKHNLSRILLAVGLALFAADASAQASQAVTITAAVAKSCSVTAATGAIDMTATPYTGLLLQNSAYSVGINCNKGTTYYWDIDNGGADDGTTRRMTANVGGTDYLAYLLDTSTDAGASWVSAPLDMLAGVAGVRSTGRLATMNLGLRVTIPAGQDPATDFGSYVDVVNVNIDIAP